MSATNRVPSEAIVIPVGDLNFADNKEPSLNAPVPSPAKVVTNHLFSVSGVVGCGLSFLQPLAATNNIMKMNLQRVVINFDISDCPGIRL
jgi:hypothetical protein